MRITRASALALAGFAVAGCALKETSRPSSAEATVEGPRILTDLVSLRSQPELTFSIPDSGYVVVFQSSLGSGVVMLFPRRDELVYDEAGFPVTVKAEENLLSPGVHRVVRRHLGRGYACFARTGPVPAFRSVALVVLWSSVQFEFDRLWRRYDEACGEVDPVVLVERIAHRILPDHEAERSRADLVVYEPRSR